jgi:hypothetical protein
MIDPALRLVTFGLHSMGGSNLFTDLNIIAPEEWWPGKRREKKLGGKVMWREMAEANGSYELREPTSAYDVVFDLPKEDLRQNNTSFWHIKVGRVRPRSREAACSTLTGRASLNP